MTDMARVGLFLDWSDPEPDEEGVFGRDIAVDSFCEALLQHARPGLFRFFRNSPVLRPGSLESRYLLESAAPHLRPVFAEMRDLKSDFEAHPFAVWHDLDGNLQLAQDLRSRYAQRPYPVTATPHVFSYATLGHNWILRMLLQPGLPCDAMICPTPSARQSFSNMVAGVSEALGRTHGLNLKFNPRLDVIPFGVDTDLFAPRPKKQVRQYLDLPEDALILMWIGRLSPVDKADLLPLIRVFSQLIEDNPDRKLVLVIAGSGHRWVSRTLKSYARSLSIEEHVLFRDAPTDERHLLHSAADIFLSPADSIQETFGITPIEAMACGVPQVVSDWNGYRDTVCDGETGFRITTMMADCDEDISLGAGVYDNYDMFDHLLMGQRVVVDPYQMQERLQTLISNPDLLHKMGAASRERALQNYDWRGVVRKYEALWDELIDIAVKTEWSPGAHDDYEALRLGKIFGHYATERVKPTFRLTLSHMGLRVCRGDEVLPAYHSALGALSTSLLRAALRSLRGEPRAFGALAKELVGQTACTQEQAQGHLMWLVKMGLASRST